MQKINNISEASPSNLFLVRGNKVQLYDYRQQAVLRETTFDSNPEFVELKSNFSEDKQCFVVYSTTEFAMFNLTGDVILREKEKGLSRARFLEDSSKYFLKITKVQLTYILTLYSFTGKSIEKLSTFEACFFKPSFDYVRVDSFSGIIGVQTKPMILNFFKEENGNLQSLNQFESKTQIVEFQICPNRLIVTADDLKDEKPTLSVSVFEFGEKIILEHKRIFNNVQEANLICNSKGSIILVNAHRYVDPSSNSYYGMEKVFFYNLVLKQFDTVVTYKGNIHNVKIDSSEKQFMVISGSVPSFSVLYEEHNNPAFMISHDFRNQVFFAPNNAFVALTGFGSLNGEIEIWNYLKKEQIGFCNSSCASFLKWSSDSSYFLTAIVVEKLKVDHRISVFSYNGVLIKRINFDLCDIISVDFAFCKESNQKIIQNPEKRIKPQGLVTIKHKMEAQKIDADRITNYAPGEGSLVKTPTSKPTLTVGNNVSGGGANTVFFNSKKNDRPNKFKAKKED